MADESAQQLLDTEEHQKTYVAIMKSTGLIIIPVLAAFSVFFVNLVIRNGVGSALAGAVFTYLLAFFIVRTFFSH